MSYCFIYSGNEDIIEETLALATTVPAFKKRKRNGGTIKRESVDEGDEGKGEEGESTIKMDKEIKKVLIIFKHTCLFKILSLS